MEKIGLKLHKLMIKDQKLYIFILYILPVQQC